MTILKEKDNFGFKLKDEELAGIEPTS